MASASRRWRLARQYSRFAPSFSAFSARRLRAELICRRKQNLAVQLLDRHAVLDETRRQILEQFRIGWRIAHLAEIIRRFHDARSEMPLPHAVDDHARRDVGWPRSPSASSRRPLPFENGLGSGGDKTDRKRSGTGSPSVCGLPRTLTCISCMVFVSLAPCRNGYGSWAFFSASISARNAATCSATSAEKCRSSAQSCSDSRPGSGF